MRDEDDRPGEAVHERLELREPVRVEVVRRLVEEKEVGFHEEDSREGDPCRLAAGEPVEQLCRGRRRARPARTSPPRARRGRRRRARGTARGPRRSGRTALVWVTTSVVRVAGESVCRGLELALGRQRRRSAGPAAPRSVSPGRRSGSCRRWATVARGGSSATTPASGASSPASSRRTVDLPTPFGPTSPMRARGPTSSDAFSRTTCAPWDFVTPVRRARMTMNLLTGRDAAPPERRADRSMSPRSVRHGRAPERERTVSARAGARSGAPRAPPSGGSTASSACSCGSTFRSLPQIGQDRRSRGGTGSGRGARALPGPAPTRRRRARRRRRTRCRSSSSAPASVASYSWASTSTERLAGARQRMHGPSSRGRERAGGRGRRSRLAGRPARAGVSGGTCGTSRPRGRAGRARAGATRGAPDRGEDEGS